MKKAWDGFIWKIHSVRGSIQCFRIEFNRVYSWFFNNKRCLKFNLSATDKKSEILDSMKSLCIESQIIWGISNKLDFFNMTEEP